MKNFKQMVEDRRSYYFNKNSQFQMIKSCEIIEHAIKYVPSAFNSQSQSDFLLGKPDRLWRLQERH